MYNIKVYPDSYIVCDEKYGYNYFCLSFLDVAEELTDDDQHEIVTRMAAAFGDYMKERMAKTFGEHMDYEKHADDVMAANLGEDMPYSNRRPPGCPQEVYDALDVFTDEELESLVSDYSWETGEFLGIGFLGPGGMFCTFAEPIKAAAIAVLDEQCKKELYAAMSKEAEYLTQMLRDKVNAPHN